MQVQTVGAELTSRQKKKKVLPVTLRGFTELKERKKQKEEVRLCVYEGIILFK